MFSRHEGRHELIFRPFLATASSRRHAVHMSSRLTEAYPIGLRLRLDLLGLHSKLIWPPFSHHALFRATLKRTYGKMSHYKEAASYEREGILMDVTYERCCGIDVHKRSIVACLKCGKKQEIRTFGTASKEIRALAKWLLDAKCQMSAMESTGSYWKPSTISSRPLSWASWSSMPGI